MSIDGKDPILLAARDGVSQGDLPRALHAYQHLIQRKRLLDEILPDLAQLAKQYPRDPRVWQILGDALARADRAEHATQAHDRARKLMEEQDSSELSKL